MYVLVFKQGQTAVSASLSAIGGMYEDNLYLSNRYEYLEQAAPAGQDPLHALPLPGWTRAVRSYRGFPCRRGESL